MPRIAGHDKQAVERRNAKDDLQITAHVMRELIADLSILQKHEINTKDFPTDLQLNITEKVEQLNEMIIDLIEGIRKLTE